MTGRDLRWRAAGATLAVASCGARLLDPDGSPATIVYFLAAILGIVLMVNGKRVAIVWLAERRGHHHTAEAVHAERLRRRTSGEHERSPPTTKELLFLPNSPPEPAGDAAPLGAASGSA